MWWFGGIVRGDSRLWWARPFRGERSHRLGSYWLARWQVACATDLLVADRRIERAGDSGSRALRSLACPRAFAGNAGQDCVLRICGASSAPVVSALQHPEAGV